MGINMRRNLRSNGLKNLIAVLVIIISFVVAIGLALISNSRATYWIATRDLIPGHQIEPGDFKAAKGAFSAEAKGYIPQSAELTGYSISKFLAAGEYLNQSSIYQTQSDPSLKLLSFAVAAPDLPSNIRLGDMVTLYQVINDSNNGLGDNRSIPSQLIIEGVYLVDINRKSENIAGTAIVTASIPNEFVSRTLDATRMGRIVVVANHG
jgi:hypothetical protein